MQLKTIRDWLLQQGVPAEHLDRISEPPVIRDIGEGLLLSLQNDDDIGNTLVMLLSKIDELEERIVDLEGGGADA
ncbi:hypothetical protein [Paenibacillus sp. MBLB4367]|uniref:hypothetical protein n=1 Tax=Paenibacillus sp. MBLB4367 TaxID=3384767 RepID=UPI0039081040